MIAVAVVVGVSLTLAAATAATTVSSRWHADPVDPAPEQRTVERALRRSARVRAAVRRHTDRWSAGTALVVTSLVVLLAVGVVIGVLLDMIDEQRGLASLDARVATWGAEHRTDTSTRVVEAITQLGARPVVLAALVLVAAGDQLRRRNREVFAFVATVGLGEMVLGNVIIYAFGVPVLMSALSVDFRTALTLGVTPFLLGDVLKIVIAGGLLPSTWKLVGPRD